jgi:hypothetical protein
MNTDDYSSLYGADLDLDESGNIEEVWTMMTILVRNTGLDVKTLASISGEFIGGLPCLNCLSYGHNNDESSGYRGRCLNCLANIMGHEHWDEVALRRMAWFSDHPQGSISLLRLTPPMEETPPAILLTLPIRPLTKDPPLSSFTKIWRSFLRWFK